MMSTSTVGMRKAFTLSRITLTLCQSHRFVRTKHSYLYSAFHSAGVTYTPTYTAVTSMQYARLLSKSFSSGFPPENDHPLQPAKPEQITTANIDDVGPTLTVDVNVPVEQLYGKIRHLHSDVVLEMLQTSYKQLDKTALAISLRRLHQVMMILPEEAREGYIEHVRTSAGFQVRIQCRDVIPCIAHDLCPHHPVCTLMFCIMCALLLQIMYAQLLPVMCTNVTDYMCTTVTYTRQNQCRVSGKDTV